MLFPFSFMQAQGPTYDVDALAFFARVTAAGGTLSLTEKTATNQLVLDLKANSLWTPMKAIYPMVGASAEACKQNLKSSSFTGTFSSGWTFASTGATPNGTSAYMDTTLNGSTTLLNDSTHLSFYSRTNPTATTCFEMGGYTSTGALLACNYLGLGTISQLYIYAIDSVTSAAFTDTRAFYIINRSSINSNKLFRNSTLLGTNTTTRTSTLASTSIVIGYGKVASYSSRQCAFASIGDGLTDTQASNFYTAVQAFQTTLSRNV
jgi:hypothetical protein